MKRLILPIVLIFIGYLRGAGVSAQESTFVDEETFRLLNNELSGDIAKDNLKVVTRYHRPGGSQGFHDAAQFIIEKAKEFQRVANQALLFEELRLEDRMDRPTFERGY